MQIQPLQHLAGKDIGDLPYRAEWVGLIGSESRQLAQQRSRSLGIYDSVNPSASTRTYAGGLKAGNWV